MVTCVGHLLIRDSNSLADADSDEVAQAFRDDVARRSEMMPPGEAFAQRAALRYADKFEGATLILHGSEDHRGGVVDQARLLAERLQANGKIVRLRVYDSTSHSIPISARWEEIDPFLKQINGK